MKLISNVNTGQNWFLGGAKLLYANFSIRGYPFGVQVGKDPRNLSIEIKPEFTYVSYKQIPVKLIRFISWGCAPPEVK